MKFFLIYVIAIIFCSCLLIQAVPAADISAKDAFKEIQKQQTQMIKKNRVPVSPGKRSAAAKATPRHLIIRHLPQIGDSL